MDIVTKLTRDKKIPTEADLRRAIKREGARWRPELGMLLLIKHEARPTSQSTQEFCKRIGLKNTNRIHYWRNELEWSKKKAAIMKAAKEVTGNNGFKVKPDTVQHIEVKSPQQIHHPPANPAAPSSYTSVRYRIEEMASELKAIGEKYPDLQRHTASIRAEMGKFVHFTIDREFTDTVPAPKVDLLLDSPENRAALKSEVKTALNGEAKHKTAHHTSS